MTAFTINCVPPKSTHQASLRIMKRRDGTQFVGKCETSKGKKVQRELLTLFAEHRPPEMLSGPLGVAVDWVYPWRKSEPKKNRTTGLKPCDTRPDVDNLAKCVLDIMTRLGFWGDDGQVAALTFCKFWGDKPRIGVSIWEL